MKFAFVYPPFRHKKFNENISTVDHEFGVYPPLGLAYAAAVAREHGVEVSLIDANALRLSLREVEARLEEFAPDILCFDLHSAYVFFDTLEWIECLRASTGARVLVGGFNFDLFPREVMSHHLIDFGLRGQASTSIPLFLRHLGGDLPAQAVAGLAHRENGGVVFNGGAPEVESLEDLPFPARDLLPVDRYYSFISQRKNFTVMLSQRGCPFRCRFCAIAGVRPSHRSVEHVISEIEECYERHGVREIDFFDGTFTVNRDWTRRFCRELTDRRLDLVWSCRTRIDCVDEELLGLMAASGCNKIYYGIESADDGVRANIRKRIKPGRTERVVSATRAQGIESLGFFMIGNPGDTRETVEQSIGLARQLNLEYVQFSRTIAKPNTELAEELCRITGSDYWREYLLGRAAEERMPNPWCELDDSLIERLTKLAYLSFYLRPAYLLLRLRKVRSFAELHRFVRTGLKMVLSLLRNEDSPCQRS